MHYSCYYNNRDWQKDYEKVCNHSIGQGTFGKVSLVRSRATKAQYAMKEIDLRQHILKSSLINRSYALDEGLKLIKLDMKHENIISYHRAYIYNEHIFWIMDYCDGGTLRERISLYAKQNRFLEENLIWYWALHILQGRPYFSIIFDLQQHINSCLNKITFMFLFFFNKRFLITCFFYGKSRLFLSTIY